MEEDVWKDKFGRQIKYGDFLLRPRSVGRAARIYVCRVVGRTATMLRVIEKAPSWSERDVKNSRLNIDMLSLCVKISGDALPDSYHALKGYKVES